MPGGPRQPIWLLAKFKLLELLSILFSRDILLQFFIIFHVLNFGKKIFIYTYKVMEFLFNCLDLEGLLESI